MDIVKECVRPESCYSGIGKVQLQVFSYKDTGKEMLLFGSTMNGDSVLVRVNKFESFFYVKPRTNDHFLCEQDIINFFKGDVDDYLVPDPVLPRIDVVERAIVKDAISYGQVERYLKVSFPDTKMRRKLSNAIRDGQLPTVSEFGIFEDTIVNPQHQFIATTNVIPCQFVEVENLDLVARKIGKTQIEVCCDARQCTPLPSIDMNAKVTIFSTDIEVESRPNIFPEPLHDAVICISCVIRGPFCNRNLLLTYRTCKFPDNTNKKFELCLFKDEKKMLEGFAALINATDPDIITGYNVMDFDINYILRRSDHLGVKSMRYIGRIAKTKTWQREDVFKSRQKGKRVTKMTDIDGRVVFDLLPVMKNEEKLESYSLGFVSSKMLGHTKEDVPHYMISTLWNGSDEDRYRLFSYCVKDSTLCNDGTPESLMVKKQLLNSYVQLARICRTPIHMLVFKGQQERVIAQLMPMLMDPKLICPYTETRAWGDDSVDDKKKGYKGGLVLDPEVGYYTNEIVACLDYNSLYPTTIQRFNLCYTTLIPRGQEHLWSPDQYELTPDGQAFLKAEVRKGILPLLLDNLLGNRKKEKIAMESATDPEKKEVHNKRQLALKLSANSVYGFTGATVGKLPCVDIAAAVTSHGQNQLRLAQSLAKSYGYKVVYGDTDSIFVVVGMLGTTSMKEAFDIANQLCSKINATFKAPLKMEVEKLLTPAIFIQKKMYICVMWMNPDKPKEILFKGVSAVRRDRIPILRKTMRKFMDLLLLEKNQVAAYDFLSETIQKIYVGSIHITDLIMSMSLSDSIENYGGKASHVEAAKRAKQRDPSYEASPGSRIPFVYVEGIPGSNTTELSEDPLYVIESGKKLLYDKYVEYFHAAFTPILKLVYGQKKARQVFLKRSSANQAKAPVSLNISPFLKSLGVKPLCTSCKKPIEFGKLLCDTCTNSVIGENERKKRIDKLNLDIEECNKAWSTCEKCQNGDLVSAKMCVARDCHNFYVRAVAIKTKEMSEKAVKGVSA